MAGDPAHLDSASARCLVAQRAFPGQRPAVDDSDAVQSSAFVNSDIAQHAVWPEVRDDLPSLFGDLSPKSCLGIFAKFDSTAG